MKITPNVIWTVVRYQIIIGLIFLSTNLELKCVLSRFIFKFISVIYHSSFQTWPPVNKASTHMV